MSLAEQSEMNFGRYKHFSWDKAYEARVARLQRLIGYRAPRVLIEINARLVLEAFHGGPWRYLWACLKHELYDLWVWYGFLRWEWIRVHLLRRKPNQAIADAERLDQEDAAIEELARQL